VLATLDSKAGQTEGGNTTGKKAWEKRERGGLYYTRSSKLGGKVVREYIGAGMLGKIAALEDERERHRREEEAAFWREEREQLEALSASVDELCEAAETIARAVLLAAGFRRHNRSEWRRQRDQRTSSEE
jgi:hypothetical protein